MNGSASPCVVGILPPQVGPWIIFDDTTITPACAVEFHNDVHVLAGKLFSVQGSLNTTGWINVSQGALMEVAGGAIHVRGGPPGVQLQVFTGAVLSVAHAVLELDGLGAPGGSNRANINFTDVQVTSRGYFGPTVDSLVIRLSTVNVTAPPEGTGQNGGAAQLRVGGRISADVSQSTFIVQGAAGGVGTQGGRGGDGGDALADFQPKVISRVNITVTGGDAGKGGQGANGASGGDGGTGGEALLTVGSGTVASTNICVFGGGGGIGARGSDGTSTSAGHGGQGRPGGSATFEMLAPDTASVAFTEICVVGGPGGSGGSGGKYTGGEATKKGGDGGAGSNGGTAKIEISAPNLVRITDTPSQLFAHGGAGGLGGNYGLGTPSQPGSNGKPGAGGPGGAALAWTNSSALDLDTNRSKVRADGGAGGNGGNAYQEGGKGGNGGNAQAGAFGLNSVRIVDSCYNATGGRGGPGGPGSFPGLGGDGGNGEVRITSGGIVEMMRACAGGTEGAGGASSEAGRAGPPGLPNLFLNATGLTLRDSNYADSIDDFGGCTRSAFYNVSFTRLSQEVIPLGCAVVDIYWALEAYVDNGDVPIQGATISITRPSTTDSFFVNADTNAAGRASFELIGSTKTSSTSSSTSHTYSVEASYRGEVRGPIQLTLSRSSAVAFTFPENTHAPVITILLPKSQAYTINADHPTITLKYAVTDPDDAITHIPTIFKAYACITQDPICLDWIDISGSRAVDPNTGEVTYTHVFDVSKVSDYPAGEYDICGQVFDGIQSSAKTCVGITLIQAIHYAPTAFVSAGGNVREKATVRVNFDGRVSNLDRLEADNITILVYRWDYDGDGVWDYNSPNPDGGSTIHIYPQVATTTTYTARFGVVDSLGREYSDTRVLTIDPMVTSEPGFLWTYFWVIMYTVGGAIGLSVAAFGVQRRRARIEADEAQRREAEILANIFECPRCGDLLPEKFAICVRCGTEDAIASARKTVAELKQIGVIVLEEEDMIDKAAVAFEGRDFQTANAFLDKVKSRVDVNLKRHRQTTQLIRRLRLHIRMLQEQGKDLSSLEPELYHTELALGRSDFDGAEHMVDSIRKKIQGFVYEDKKREILERLTRLERNIKAFEPTDEASTARAAESMKLLERAKVALGRRSYLEAVGYYNDAFTQMEGAPPEPLVTEPTDTELDLFETRIKMQEEGVYMGPSSPRQAEEKVWRPGEKEFKVQEAARAYRPGEGAGVMTEDHAHGRTQDAPPPAAPQAPVKPTGPSPPAPPASGLSAPVKAAQPTWSTGPARPATSGPAPAPAAPAAIKPAAPPAPASSDVMEVAKPAPPKLATPPSPAKPAAPAALKCAVCGTALQQSWLKCPKCATPVPGSTAVRPAAPQAPPAPAAAPATLAPSPQAAVAEKCPNCAKPVKPAWKKCPYCAHVLHG
jgi:hypothetical protein